ncbi:MAG: hypothetical protein Q8M01_21865 [Rubrivivax sp.]|nr:hypothetical protein [Rubrivivax sp.]
MDARVSGELGGAAPAQQALQALQLFPGWCGDATLSSASAPGAAPAPTAP